MSLCIETVIFPLLLESVFPKFDHYLKVYTFSASGKQFQFQKV
jgi:hypothetical protein